MNEDQAFAKFLDIMRRQGSKDNPTTIEIGVMKDATTCMLGDLELDTEDLLYAEHLVTGYHKAVDSITPSLKNDDTFIYPLKAGDTVVLMRLYGTGEDQDEPDTYIILDKVVSL